MKINIWIKKEEVISGNITGYYTQVKNIGYENYIMISISRDEFTRLQDNMDNFDLENNHRVQYSKALKNANSANKTGAMIHERNPDTGTIRSREIKDGDGEIKTSTIERSDDGFENFVLSLNGGEFIKWYERATEKEKSKYDAILDNLKNKRK